jgi:hypothetical protein
MSDRQKRKARVRALWARRRGEVACLLQARTGDYGHAIMIDYEAYDSGGELVRRAIRIWSPAVRKISPKKAAAQIEKRLESYELLQLRPSGYKRVRHDH